ncbi:conserved hypothetical protein [Chthoniobacter flavus Ellin428]|uniref:Uncharacterized protein n=1 Tax=Chthoniobacter flavus Ellin428 TaxID=497964 RepID=B4D0W0_9BACT|nr:hypothetical protein [Chthoniobacter flavus]EDY19972.1 conserved hypothetical protein [Chthoniobacter flavus Ellin428]TCO91759.1 hypothetical protein EV701_10740 [Chthoniobacter flavus]
MIPRRSFLQAAAGTGALAALGELGFLAQLPSVSAAEVAADPRMVRFDAETEPLVRLLEDTPRERVLEEVAARVKGGLSYRQLLTALFLAGVRSIQPRPVGFKFHAVLVINSAHLASLASPDSDRWLPIFWAIDQFKVSQASNQHEGNWVLPPIDEAAVPASHKARAAFIEAMDRWDEAGADAAIAGLVRTHTSADDLFEIFCRIGSRDFREIGHKAIYVSNSFRCLEVIGWQHAEPVLRSLAYALLDRAGTKENPADADLPADRPFRDNLTRVKSIRDGWLIGKPSAEASADLLQAIRSGSPSDTSTLVTKLLNDRVAPQSIFDGLFTGAGELLMQAPGILSLHATTFTNAVHYAWHRAQNDETRRLLLLQNAAFLPLFRGNHTDSGLHIDTLEPLAPDAKGDEAVAEIFADISHNRLNASRKILAWLKDKPDASAFATAARRLIFLKGNNAHDYKFSSAVLEDYQQLSPPWRDQLLAASAFYFRGSGDKDNDLVQHTRSALGA